MLICLSVYLFNNNESTNQQINESADQQINNKYRL